MLTISAQLVRLLSDPSLSVQQSAYQLLVRIADQHVSSLVVEVELDAEAIRLAELPPSLMSLLESKLDRDILQNEQDHSKVSQPHLQNLWASSSDLFISFSCRHRRSCSPT